MTYDDNPFDFWLEFFDNKILKKRMELGTTDIAFNMHGEHFPYMEKKGMVKITDDITIIFQKTYKDLELPNHLIPAEDRVYSFENFLKKELEGEISNTKQKISVGFVKRLGMPSETSHYRAYLMKFLNHLKNHSNNKFDVTASLLDEFKAHIELNSSNQKKTNDIHSFELISPSNRSAEELMQLLYSLLTTTPPIISVDFKDFESAFSNKEISKGINWLVKSKNGSTSKVSLFYFIEQLIDEGFLSKSILNDLNKKIKYVFRDMDGQELKNIRQSRSTISYTNTPAQKPRIDSIISSLKEE